MGSFLQRIRRHLGQGLIVAMLALSGAPALASLSQGFATSSPIATGSLVALDPKSSGAVVIADLNNVDRLFGVVVPPSSASISLSGSNGQVQVVTTGSADVLVSTAGGDIHTGDYVSVSPISGVGQRVGQSSTRVVGTAAADFNGTGEGVTKRTIDIEGGGTREVSIGQIPVVIAVSSYTATDGVQSYAIPNWLQHLSNTLAGKAVSPVRIIVAGLILMVAIISISVLLYSAVRNSIISIGRNPLARAGVLQGMLAVGGVAMIILAVSAGAIFLVITR